MQDTTQNSFITNQDKFLSEIIDGILPKSSSVDILVGYFYYSGFEQIYKNIEDKQLRILVGLEVDTRIMGRVREIDAFSSGNLSRGQIKDNYYNSLVRLFNETDSFDSDEKITAFELFYKKIKDGTLEIRKTTDPCHAKMYLFEYNDMVNEGGEAPGTVITGSSNLSHAGLKGRLEINARFDQKQYYIDGKAIFNELWKDAISIADSETIGEFDEKVIKHIWYEKLYAPYLMYVRVLHEYFTIPTQENLLTPYDITDGKYYNLKYQTDATQMALNAIDNHNGVIIADVVGLGKSIIASTVARNLKLRTIIVSPPHLTSQWEEYKDEFKFTATVFSSGRIEEAVLHYKNIVNDQEQFLIIIDEAHKYKNEYTQDYANLHDLCMGNKVMLLTATPFNNRPDDIYSMLKLFQVPTKSTLKTIDNLGAEFKELIKQYKELTKDQKSKKISDTEVVDEANRIASKIRSIISPLVVRRSRLDLEYISDYKQDLELQKIETVIPNDPEELEYNLFDVKDLYLHTLELLSKPKSGESKFKSARYQPISYSNEHRAELEKILKEKTGIKYNLMIGTQTNLSDFMRRLLVRRFESSVFAFKQSLDYMIASHGHILEWIDKRGAVPIYKKGYLPSVTDFYNSDNDNIEEELTDKLEKYEKKGFFEIDVKYINKDAFVTDVTSDMELLQSIRIKWFGEDKIIKSDYKLDSFKALLRRMREEDPKRKIIVFTEFADTANYLGDALKDENLGVMRYTSKDSSRANKEAIRANFDAGYKADFQKDDFQVLIATDAISEGYNLHRAGAIFNYDIPYNPTRVIQRIGRINRINKKMFNELYIYNYFPTDVGESETRTKEISSLKMAMIHAIMGEDTKVLTKYENPKSYFVEQYRREIQRSETVSWDTRYKDELNKLKGTDIYNEAINIPHRARTGREVGKPLRGVLMFGKKGNDYIFKICDETLSPISLTAEEALSLFEAARDEKCFETSDNFDRVYQVTKSSLFSSDVSDTNEKERLKAMEIVKVIAKLKVISKDYIEDLMNVIKLDGLSGYELRFINKLTPKEFASLPKEIGQTYLDRIITSINKIDDSSETLILSEEIL